MSKSKILVVDDEYNTVARLMDDLRDEGFEVDFLPEISRAREMIDTCHEDFSAVLIDIMFPQGDRNLDEYERILMAKSRHSYLESRGQSLGLYINEHYPALPYAYLSLRPSAFVCTGTEFHSCQSSSVPGRPWLLNKLDLIKQGNVAAELQQLIKQWPTHKVGKGSAA